MPIDVKNEDVWVVGYGVNWMPQDWGKLTSDDGQHVKFDNRLPGPDIFWDRKFVCFFSTEQKAREACDAEGKIMKGDIPR